MKQDHEFKQARRIDLAQGLGQNSAGENSPCSDPHPATDALIESLAHLARLYGVPYSTVDAQHFAEAMSQYGVEQGKARIEALARHMGFGASVMPVSGAALAPLHLPLLLAMNDGSVAIVCALDGAHQAQVVFTGEGGQETSVPLDSLLRDAGWAIMARPLAGAPDLRVDAYIQPHAQHWFRPIFSGAVTPFFHVIAASFVINSLALSGVIFSMQIYDRVIPAQSAQSLYVLFSGVVIAVLFEFMLRLARTSLVDQVGKAMDMRLSDLIFGRVLRIREDARPQSTGSFIAQIRDLDHVREMLASTSMAAVADLPFFLLFLVVFWIIGGELVLVPALALVLLIVPGLLAQRALRRHTRAAMREASLRNAMLVETIQGIEDIKMLQAEHQIMSRWNHLNRVTADAQLRQRGLTAKLTSWGQCVQTGVFAAIICVGAPQVMEGEMSTGVLVACSILGARITAPMSHVTQILARWQQARTSFDGLANIMTQPLDHPPAERRVSMPALRGNYGFQKLRIQRSGAKEPALSIDMLDIAAGEQVALLGRNGAGKSTLLQAMAGLLHPKKGEILLDGVSLGAMDPADLRRGVGFVSQTSRLFYGSIRDNLRLGQLNVTEEACHEALQVTGAENFVRALPDGLDHMIMEGGRGLSGGQVQALLLSRMLVRRPSIILLDEPTAAMDEASEQHFIRHFGLWSRGCTVLVATHRLRILDLVTRVVALDKGRVVLDEARDVALAKLTGAV